MARGQTPAYVNGCRSARPPGRRARGSSRAGTTVLLRRRLRFAQGSSENCALVGDPEPGNEGGGRLCFDQRR
jgi:hypothetical protein